MGTERAGAVIYQAQQAEERLCDEIDERRGPGRWAFGEASAVILPTEIATPQDFIEFCVSLGWRVKRHNHPKTKARWLPPPPKPWHRRLGQ